MEISSGNYSVYCDYHRHSVLVVAEVEESLCFYIPMASEGLSVHTLSIERFQRDYTQRLDYPPDKAAKIYLEHAKLFGATDLAMQLLKAVAEGQEIQFNPGEIGMATKDEVKAASDAVDGALKNGKGGEGAPAKKAAAKKAPAKGAAKKEAAPVKKAGKAVKETPASSRGAWKEAAHKIGDASSVKKGALKEYVDFAAESKKFTLSDLDAWARKKKDFGDDVEARSARNERYFAWCRSKGIFVEA